MSPRLDGDEAASTKLPERQIIILIYNAACPSASLCCPDPSARDSSVASSSIYDAACPSASLCCPDPSARDSLVASSSIYDAACPSASLCCPD
eukprot:gene14471-20492_t